MTFIERLLDLRLGPGFKLALLHLSLTSPRSSQSIAYFVTALGYELYLEIIVDQVLIHYYPSSLQRAQV